MADKVIHVKSKEEYDKILNEFYDEIEPITRDVPYMVGPGNHEANCDNGANLTLCLPGQLNFYGISCALEHAIGRLRRC